MILCKMIHSQIHTHLLQWSFRFGTAWISNQAFCNILKAGNFSEPSHTSSSWGSYYTYKRVTRPSVWPRVNHQRADPMIEDVLYLPGSSSIGGLSELSKSLSLNSEWSEWDLSIVFSTLIDQYIEKETDQQRWGRERERERNNKREWKNVECWRYGKETNKKQKQKTLVYNIDSLLVKC